MENNEENKFNENSESAVDRLPKEFVSDLLGKALEEDDPAMRDFGVRYDYRDILGRGGQGIVLSVKDKILEREVALKTLKGHSNKVKAEYLEREALISANLEHPNIPPTYDLGFDETGSPFFVMRKVEGISLDQILRHKKKALKQGDEKPKKRERKEDEYSRIHLLSIFIQVCNAIEYAHSRNVLHLDIKPQNVKLGPYGEVFVLDWGFASKKDEEQKIVGGTPIYIAPERLKRQTPDERSDVYSLGVLLYRMLTLEKPFNVSSLSFKDFCAKYESLSVITPRERDQSIPPELEAIILKAMAKERDGRYKSVKNLSTDLQHFLDGLPVSAFDAGKCHRAWKLVKRHPTVSILVAALLVAFIGIGTVARHNYKMNKERIKTEKLRLKKEKALQLAQAIRNSASIPYQKGRDFLEKTPPQLLGAKRYFSSAISIDPKFAEAYFERGKVHSRLGNNQEALADFRQSLSLKPNFVMAHYYSGIILMDVAEFKNMAAAKNEFEIMQQIDPGNEYSNLGLARMKILNNELPEALELCAKIENRSPDFKEVNYLKGYIFGKKDNTYYDPKKALENYDIYLNTIKDNVSAYLNRGDLRQREGDIDGAISDYNKALELNPEYVWALNNRGWVYYSAKKNTAKALEDFNKAANARPEYYWTYMNRAAVYEYLGKWNEAEEDYNWASDLTPDSEIVYERKGLCFFRQKRFAAAHEAFKKALEIKDSKDKPSLDFNVGVTYYAEHKYREAIDYFNRALKQKSNISFYAAMLRHITILKISKNPDPKDLNAFLVEDDENNIWQKTVLKCWQAIITPDMAMAELSKLKPPALSKSLFYIGMYQKIIENDPVKAAQSLKKCITTGNHLYTEYVLATAEQENDNK